MIKNEVFGIVWYIFGQCSMTVHSQISIYRMIQRKRMYTGSFTFILFRWSLCLGLWIKHLVRKLLLMAAICIPTYVADLAFSSLMARASKEQTVVIATCLMQPGRYGDMVIEQIATGATPRFCNLCTPGNEISKKTNLYCRSQQKEADMIVTLILASSFAMREELQWRAFYFGEVWNIHMLLYFIIC